MGLFNWIADCFSSTDTPPALTAEAPFLNDHRTVGAGEHMSLMSGDSDGVHGVDATAVDLGGHGMESSTRLSDSPGEGMSWEILSPGAIEERGFNPDTGLLTMGDRFGVDTNGNFFGTGDLTMSEDHFGSGQNSDSGWSPGSSIGGSDW